MAETSVHDLKVVSKIRRLPTSLGDNQKEAVSETESEHTRRELNVRFKETGPRPQYSSAPTLSITNAFLP